MGPSIIRVRSGLGSMISTITPSGPSPSVVSNQGPPGCAAGRCRRTITGPRGLRRDRVSAVVLFPRWPSRYRCSGCPVLTLGARDDPCQPLIGGSGTTTSGSTRLLKNSKVKLISRCTVSRWAADRPSRPRFLGAGDRALLKLDLLLAPRQSRGDRAGRRPTGLSDHRLNSLHQSRPAIVPAHGQSSRPAAGHSPGRRERGLYDRR